MRVTPGDAGGPVAFEALPQQVQAVMSSLVEGLKATLNDNLFAVYLYGAMVFPETKYVQDIDFHVILRRGLTYDDKEQVKALHERLCVSFPQFKDDDLDGYYILLSDARQVSIPWHQIYPDIPDETWPLHIAHMRAGYCIVLFGPEPKSFLPEPTWKDLSSSLQATLRSTFGYLDSHPDYCILNFCRILYSFSTRDVVVSKSRAASWARQQLPQWSGLIDAALRVFQRDEHEGDRQLLVQSMEQFKPFIIGRIETLYED